MWHFLSNPDVLSRRIALIKGIESGGLRRSACKFLRVPKAWGSVRKPFDSLYLPDNNVSLTGYS